MEYAKPWAGIDRCERCLRQPDPRLRPPCARCATGTVHLVAPWCVDDPGPERDVLHMLGVVTALEATQLLAAHARFQELYPDDAADARAV